ncbi:hypothetical protein [Mycolicibacterium palauense]|uniref:hypothetical protein n=1 Tax=Mycolicibacterium palauense TaxID=2034511 RepID=UPI00114600AE|nr:hypothetical protein [Mycolicibacterium palauense]
MVQATYSNTLIDLGDGALSAFSLITYPRNAYLSYQAAIDDGDTELARAVVRKALTEPVEAALEAPVRFVTEYALPVLASLTVYPVANATLATLYALRDVGEAIADANLVDIVNAVLSIPGKIITGVVNGFVDWDNYDAATSGGFPPTDPTAFPSLLANGADPENGHFNGGFLPLLVDFFNESVPVWRPPTTSSDVSPATDSEIAPASDTVAEIAPDTATETTPETTDEVANLSASAPIAPAPAPAQGDEPDEQQDVAAGTAEAAQSGNPPADTELDSTPDSTVPDSTVPDSTVSDRDARVAARKAAREERTERIAEKKSRAAERRADAREDRAERIASNRARVEERGSDRRDPAGKQDRPSSSASSASSG